MHEILAAFAVIFLAALPGRTTVILIILSGSLRAGRLLGGAVPAFVVQCALGAFAGRLLSGLPHVYLTAATAALFFFFAFKSWSESRRETREELHEQSLFSIFGLFFMCELGDVSQMAVVSVSAQSSSTLSVFLGASIAMTLIALIAVAFGRQLGRFISARRMHLIASVLFLALGLYFGLGLVREGL